MLQDRLQGGCQHPARKKETCGSSAVVLATAFCSGNCRGSQRAQAKAMRCGLLPLGPAVTRAFSGCAVGVLLQDELYSFVTLAEDQGTKSKGVVVLEA